MDSNVSKNTNSHNFFKVPVNRHKLAISVRDLLAKELILALALYRQKFNVKIEQNLLTAIIKNKITILDWQNSFASSKNKITDSRIEKYSGSIGYQCPLGICLATVLQQSPTTIVERLGQILAANSESSGGELSFELSTEIIASGWINFYLEAQFIADWLNSCLCLSQTEIINDRASSLEQSQSLNPEQSALFPAQYIHARCCSLLSLAAREKLIILATNCQRFTPQIQDSESIIWLDEEQDLLFSESAEYVLLRHLLRLADAWVEDCSDSTPSKLSHHQWSKLAIGLSQATAVFWAECRFLGEIEQQHPQKAIARLGLIALVQFWLQRILREKLDVIAPNSM